MDIKPEHLLPIRYAILSGRAIIAVESGSGLVLGTVMEAVRAAGREADLVVLPFFGAEQCGFLLDDAVRVLPDRPQLPGLADVRALDPSEATRPGAVVVCLGDTHEALTTANCIATRYREGIPEDPATDPLLVTAYASVTERLPGLESRAYAPFRLTATATAEALARVDPAPAVAAVAWEAALRRLDDRARVEMGSEYALVAGEGRLVVVRRFAEGAGHTHPAQALAHKVQALEITPTGWLRGCELQAYGSVATLEPIARLIWRGGVHAAAIAREVEHGVIPDLRVPPGILRSLLGPEPAMPRRLREIVSAWCDLPLLESLHPFGVVGQAVHARIRAAGAARRARRDYVLTWPALATLLIDDAFLAAVDAGERTLPLVARQLGLSKGVCRRLVGRTKIPESFRAGMPCVSLLGALGPDRLPAPGDTREWDAFVHCTNVLIYVLVWSRIPDPDAGVVASLLAGIPGRSWHERSERLQACRFGSDTGDYVSAFVGYIDALVPGTPPAAAFGLLGGFGSLHRLFEAALRWHEMPHLHADGQLAPDVRWSVPFDLLDLGGGWSLRALDSMRALVDEGRVGPDADGIDGLAHCVASYGRRCLAGSSLILSLRHEAEGRERRVSTAELGRHDDGAFLVGGRRMAILQHRGRANAAPDPATEARLEGGLARVARWAVALPSHDPAANEGGIAFAAIEMIDEWRHVMPRDLARLAPDEILAHIRAAAVALAD